MYINNKTRKFKMSRKSILFLISILVVIAVFVTGIVMFSTRSKEVEDSLVPLPFAPGDAHFAVGDTLIYSDGELLTCIDKAMNTQWQFNLFAAGLSFEANDDNIAAFGDDVIHVIDANGTYLFSTQIDGVIKSAKIGADKVAVYVSQQSKEETISYIVIFDFTGQSLFKIDITNKYVLDYGFDSNSDELFVLELDASGAAPVSRISTYRAETQAMTGFKEMKDQLIERVLIVDDVIYAVGTNSLTIYSSLNEIDRQFLIYGWIPEDIRLIETPEFIYVQSSTGIYHDIARIIDASGNETIINLLPGVFSLLHAGDKIYCFASHDIFVYTIDGNYLRTHTLPFDIDSVEKAVPGYVFVTTADAVYLLPLP